MRSARHEKTGAQGSEAASSWPPMMWPQMLANMPWSRFAASDATPATSIRTGQDELIDETRQLIDHWCDRRHETVKDAWNLMAELQQVSSGSPPMEAWLNWQRSAIERLAEDWREQIEFASRAFECCSGIASQGAAIWTSPLSSTDGKDRGAMNGKSRHRVA